ncbi:MAG: F0F1 ATP synthase subunit epsilon [Egibacteraceae bacterium]
MAMEVHLVSAERELFAGEAQAVYARSVDGEIGILPGHQPAVLALGGAPLKIVTAEGEELRFAVHRGFLQMAQNTVTVLADVAEASHDIDAGRARERAEQLEREINERADEELDQEIHARLERDMTRVRMTEG